MNSRGTKFAIAGLMALLGATCLIAGIIVGFYANTMTSNPMPVNKFDSAEHATPETTNGPQPTPTTTMSGQEATETPSPTITVAPSVTCPTEAEFTKLTGVIADRVPTEACSFHWRGDPRSITPKDSCPEGWSCQLGVVNQGNILYYGGSPTVEIYAATWRLVNAYPANDPVRNQCLFLAKSQEEGRKATPQWNITAGNFTCR